MASTFVRAIGDLMLPPHNVLVMWCHTVRVRRPPRSASTSLSASSTWRDLIAFLADAREPLRATRSLRSLPPWTVSLPDLQSRAAGRRRVYVQENLVELLGKAPSSKGRCCEGLGLGFMANHFDVVPVRTNDERRIIVRVVLGTETRRTIVFATRLERGSMELFHLAAVLGGERQVEMRCLLLDSTEAQRRLAVWAANLNAERSLGDNGYAERLECPEEERLARRIVADSEYDVVEHDSPN